MSQFTSFRWSRANIPPESAHQTSISPALRPEPTSTTRSHASKLAAHYYTEHPLRINMDAIESVHETLTGEYEVDEILRSRDTSEGREYLVSWKRHTDQTWEHEDTLENVASKLAAFEASASADTPATDSGPHL
jgi:hypothetical protein